MHLEKRIFGKTHIFSPTVSEAIATRAAFIVSANLTTTTKKNRKERKWKGKETKFFKCSEPKSLEVCGHSSQRPGSKPLFIDLGANVLALVPSDVDGSWESVSGRTMKKREAGYHKCSQEQGLKTKRVFPYISFFTNTYILPEFCSLSLRGREARTKTVFHPGLAGSC